LLDSLLQEKMNLKYVELLRQSYEKYKKIDVIYSNNKIDEDGPSQELKPFSKIVPKTQVKSKKKLKHEKRTHRPKIVCEAPQNFLDFEDKIILEAMQKCEQSKTKINIPKLCQILDRKQASVTQRIKKLKLTGVSEMHHVRFSFEEDMIIIDKVLDKLKSSDKGLKEIITFPSDIFEVGSLLKRSHQSVYEHWKSIILTTILGHHNKCLNLDIKLMLANFLADNFQTTTEINWNFVLSKPEFSGHTEISVKKVFHRLVYKTSKYFSVDKLHVTCQQIAEYTRDNEELLLKVGNKKRLRQIDIIEYFEKACRRMKIEKTKLKL